MSVPVLRRGAFRPARLSGLVLWLDAGRLADDPVALTMTGNEVTDASRTAGVQGDGLTSPDSSYGIWDGTTNLFTNGGAETNLTGFTAIANGVLTRDTTESKFGSASAKVVDPGGANFSGLNIGAVTGLAAGSVTASVWLKGTGTCSLRLSENGVGSTDSSTITLTSTWTRYSVTRTWTATASATLYVWTAFGTAAFTAYVDGVQVEQKAIATPYVHTNGATATRAFGQVTLPSTLIDQTKGWASFRVRMGIPSTAAMPGATAQTLFGARNGADILAVDYYSSANTWRFTYGNTGTGLSQVTPAAGAFAIGQTYTITISWDSVATPKGVLYVNTTANNLAGAFAVPTTLTSGWTVGYGAGNSAFDGEVLWAAFGSGPLTAGDVTTISGFGNTDPSPASFPAAAKVSGVWTADTASLSPYYQDGDPVGRWQDLSSGANHATQATSSKRPAYKTAVLNGRPVVRFDGVDDWIAATLALTQPYTVYIVAKSTTALGYIMDGQATDTAVFQSNSGTVFRVATGITNLDQTVANMLTAFHVIGGVFNGASSVNAYDGATITGNAGAGNATALTLAANGARASGFVNGDFAEVIVYSRALSATERQKVERYLGRKYGLVVA